jgi:ribonuclease P protein component
VYQLPRETTTPEVGFVAGKKVGNAVARNRAKRRLRAAARQISLAPGTSYVFVASKDVLAAPFGMVIRWLEEAITYGAMRNQND